MSVKIAHLPSHIANASAVHQAQNRAIKLSKQAGTGPVRVRQASSPKETARR